MGAFAILAAVLIVLVVAGLAYSIVVVRRREVRTEPESPGWHPLHYAQDGHTVVAVARETAEGHVIEKHELARIPDQDGDWSRTFVGAKLEAEERAFHLNADSSASTR